MSTIVNISSAAQLDGIFSSAPSGLALVYFWADWAQPCKQMDVVFQDLAAENYPAHFLRVEAEALPDVSERFSVSLAPTFVFVKGGSEVDRVEGANAPDLVAKLRQHSAGATATVVTAAPAAVAPKPSSAAEPVQLTEALQQRILGLINAYPVMLFMKGSPDDPKCGFSRKTVDLLRKHNADFKTFNILNDEDVRAGLKVFSNWPTFPQLYVQGKLVGGIDILEELEEADELDSTLQSKDGLNERLTRLVQFAPVMLFMKGTPEAPRCGFSRKTVDLLKEANIEFGSFDILSDEQVRAGLKEQFNWPTYPQVYVRGQLVGGIDILQELKESGELLQTLQG